jgi:hypothetical protein
MSGQDPSGQPGRPDPSQPQRYQTVPAPGGGNTKWIVIAVFCVAFIPVIGVCTGLLLPAVQQAREAARRMSCSNNMKQIGIAMHNYHSAYNTLPPAYTTDADGRRLHSWRTFLLPFLEQQALFERIDLSKPWDDPVNLMISQTVIPTYACPTTMGDSTLTTYVAVVDPSGIMSGPQANAFRRVLDGLSNTIMFVECDSDLAVPWMKPQDINLDQFLSPGTANEAGGHQGGAHVMMGDGAVVFITDSLDVQTRQAMISKDGKEVIGMGAF